MAMTVMTIGAAAVMSMQKASVQGNSDARQTDLANSVARTVVERLQRDAMQWTLPNGANPMTSNLSNAKLLANTNAFGGWALPNAYLNPPSGGTPEGYEFDILGRDLPAASPDTVFCVNYQLYWLAPPSLPTEPGFLRADVRVLWSRYITGSPPAGWCESFVGSAIPDPTLYHAIYVSTSIRQGGGQ